MVVNDCDGSPANPDNENRVYSANTNWRTDVYGASGSGSGTMTLYCLIRNRGYQGDNQFEAYVNGVRLINAAIPVQGTGSEIEWYYYEPPPTITISSCSSFKIRQQNNGPGGTMQVGEVWLWQ